MAEPSAREQQIAQIAKRFAEYLTAQTAVTVHEPDAIQNDASRDELFSRLDAALDQMADLATVYGNDPRFDFAPLVLPAAALAGEYLRQTTGASWTTPPVDPDETLTIELAGGQQLDLTVAVRATLMSGKPNLQGMMQAVEASTEQQGEQEES